MTLREREYKAILLSSLRFSEMMRLDELKGIIACAKKLKPGYDWYLSNALSQMNSIYSLRRKIKKGDLLIDIYPAIRRCDL